MTTGKLLSPPSVNDRIHLCREHLNKSTEWKGEKRAVFNMRGKYGGYLRGLPEIKDFLKRIMVMNDTDEILELFEDMEQFYCGVETEYLPAELKNYHEKCPL
jgi:tRNA-dihydrouridine synthase